MRGDAKLLWRALRHPQAPGWLKVATLALAAYVILPIDLMPDVIPIVGVLDDMALILLSIRFPVDRRPQGAAFTDHAVGRTSVAAHYSSTTCGYPARRCSATYTSTEKYRPSVEGVST